MASQTGCEVYGHKQDDAQGKRNGQEDGEQDICRSGAKWKEMAEEEENEEGDGQKGEEGEDI